MLPRLEELYIWRAQCFQELGQLDKAIKEYDALLQISPRNAGYYIDRGVIQHSSHPEAALNDYSMALEIQSHPLAYNNRASLLARQGNFEAAIADAQSALQLDQKYHIAYATLAEIYAQMGQKEQMYLNLELAVENYFEDILELFENPIYEAYKQEERFLDLLKKTKGN